VSPRPKHPKPDANQARIVGQLRDLGFVVHDVSSLGGDCLDLFVLGWNYRLDVLEWCQVEIKTDDGELTPGEKAYIDLIMEAGSARPPVIVARSVEDVLRWFGRC
jgi:hypothetical protein